jgi:hypothetical protein
VVKLDGFGTIQWDKTIGGGGEDDLFSLQQTSDGGYILGGHSDSNVSGEKTANSRGYYDYWVVKLNSLGKIQWDKTIGGSSGDYLTSLQQTCEGGYILGGYSLSNRSGDKTEKSRGVYDYWVVKLNSLGRIQWDKTIGGSLVDYLYSLQQTSDGGYILGGDSESDMSGEKTENNHGSFIGDYWVVKLNSFGRIQWDKTIGGTSEDHLRSIKEVSKNQYILGGYSISGISGDKTEVSRGDFDYWIVWLQYNKPVSMIASSSADLQSLLSKDSKTFTAHPNPAKDIINIKTNGNAIISLTDQSGKIVLTKAIEGSGVINVTSLSAGLYYLKNNATGETQKVIIAK